MLEDLPSIRDIIQKATEQMREEKVLYRRPLDPLRFYGIPVIPLNFLFVCDSWN